MNEPNILELISELLSQCIIDTAASFETAKQLFVEITFDDTILLI
jgi:hypothetical protein